LRKPRRVSGRVREQLDAFEIREDKSSVFAGLKFSNPDGLGP
jgi:hypothetical protein